MTWVQVYLGLCMYVATQVYITGLAYVHMSVCTCILGIDGYTWLYMGAHECAWVYMGVCIWMYVCIHESRVCLSVCVCTCMYKGIHKYTCMYTCIHRCTLMYVVVHGWVYIDIQECIWVYTFNERKSACFQC